GNFIGVVLLWRKQRDVPASRKRKVLWKPDEANCERTASTVYKTQKSRVMRQVRRHYVCADRLAKRKHGQADGFVSPGPASLSTVLAVAIRPGICANDKGARLVPHPFSSAGEPVGRGP